MRAMILAGALAGCALTPNQKRCDTMIAAREHGDYDRSPEVPAALQQHLLVCEAACRDTDGLDARCVEMAIAGVEMRDKESPGWAVRLRDDCNPGTSPKPRNQLACDWAAHHKALYDEELKKGEGEENHDYQEFLTARERRQRRADEEAESAQGHGGNTGSGDPIDRVLAAADGKLRADGYETVQTLDRNGAMTFSFASHITDRMIQVVCASHDRFRGQANAGGAIGEFTPTTIDGAYAEHFAVPLDLQHGSNIDFSVTGGSGRILCRVYKK